MQKFNKSKLSEEFEYILYSNVSDNFLMTIQSILPTIHAQTQ